MGMLNTMKAQGTQYARSIIQRHKKAFSNFRKICDEMHCQQPYLSVV